MRRAGINVTSRRLRHIGPDDGTRQVLRKKGIDLRLGLDVVRMARNGDLDMAIIFSQDQDLAEVASEVRDISQSQGRWLNIVSAFPKSSAATASRGISRTD